MEAAGYVALIREGKFHEAAQLIHKRNPLAVVCGRVCYHPCESECNRGHVDKPLAIQQLKRFALDWEMKNNGKITAADWIEIVVKQLNEIETTKQDMFEVSTNKILSEIDNVVKFVSDLHQAFISKKRKDLKNSLKLANDIKANAKYLKKNIYRTVQNLSHENLKSAQYYAQVIDALREVANAVSFLAERYYEHIDNNHDIFKKKQLKDLNVLQDKLLNYILECKTLIENRKFIKIDDIREVKNQLLIDIEEVKTKQLLLIHEKGIDLITSSLYLNVLAEYKNLALYFIRIVKAQKRFYVSGKLEQKNIQK